MPPMRKHLELQGLRKICYMPELPEKNTCQGGQIMTLEVLQIIYKFPRLNPRQIHARRKHNLSTVVNNILTTLSGLNLVSNKYYSITPQGLEWLRSQEDKQT